MKRILRFIICFVFVFTFALSISCYAQNDDELIVNADSSHELLSQAKELIYLNMDRLCSKLTIVFTGKGLEAFSYEHLLKKETEFEAQIIKDYMETSGKDYNALILRGYSILKTVWKNPLNTQKASKLQIVYTFRWDEDIKDVQNVEVFCQSVINELDIKNKTQYQTVKEIHDFVVSSYCYDTSAQNEIHNPSELIEYKKGVCSAYTGLVYKLLEAAGIESRIILSEAKGLSQNKEQCHTWNLIKLDECWYHMDTTWDDPVTTFDTEKINYDYFLKGDQSILKDHSFNPEPYPAAVDDYKVSSQSFPAINVTADKKESSQTPFVDETKTKTQTSSVNNPFLMFLLPSAFISIVIFVVLFSLISLFKHR